jgi:hypothetical protein
MPDSLRSTAKVFCFRRESYRPNATLRITRLKANRPEKSQAACQPSSTSREERVCPALVPHKTPIVFILGSCQSSTRQVTRFGLLQSNVLSMPAAEPANVLVRIPVCRLRRLAPTGGAPDIADRSLCTQRRAPSLATLRLHQDRSSGMPFLPCARNRPIFLRNCVPTGRSAGRSMRHYWSLQGFQRPESWWLTTLYQDHITRRTCGCRDSSSRRDQCALASRRRPSGSVRVSPLHQCLTCLQTVL